MKILIDINHPADVHQFKHFIWQMQSKGHLFKLVARERECVFRLLKGYNFSYVPRQGHKGLLRKTIGIYTVGKLLYKIAKEFNPDILIGGPGNCYVAHVAKLLKKKSIIFDDTEYSTFQNWLTFPFTNFVCTPSSYWLELGKKQVTYKGYQELAYLHPLHYKPNPVVLAELGVKATEIYTLFRLVSWEANHDIGDRGFSNVTAFIDEFRKHSRVFITSEKPLPPKLKPYQLNLSPEKVHDAIYYSTMFIGESATMASEAAMLGIPSFFISKSKRGYTNEQEGKYGLVFNYSNQQEALQKALTLIKQPNLKQQWRKKQEIMLNDMIDVTSWMINFVETVAV